MNLTIFNIGHAFSIGLCLLILSSRCATAEDALLTAQERVLLVQFITDNDEGDKEMIWPTQRTSSSESKASVGHRNRRHPEYKYVLWPFDHWLNACKVENSKSTHKAKEHALAWLGKIVAPSMIPSDVAEKLVALKDVPTNSINWGEKSNVDLIIGQFFDQSPKWQMQETGSRLNILIIPELGIRKEQTLENFAIESLKTYFNLTAPEKESLKVTSNEQSGLVYGSMVIDPPYPNGMDDKDKGKWVRLHLRHWWVPVNFCSNGRYVFFSMYELDDPWQFIDAVYDPDRF